MKSSIKCNASPRSNCGERDDATGYAKSATTRRGNIIRVRVHQPGKQKDIYIHKAHLLNMIVLTVDIKSSIYRKCIQEIKKKRYTACVCGCVCVSVCVCMDKHVYTACVCPMSSGGEKRKKKKGNLEEEDIGGDKETVEIMDFFSKLALTCRYARTCSHALNIHQCQNTLKCVPYGNDARGDRLAHLIVPRRFLVRPARITVQQYIEQSVATSAHLASSRCVSR